MAILGSIEQIALIIALVFGVFRVGCHSFSRSTKAWYAAGSQYVKISPPAWLFGVVWPILYVIQIAAMFRYVINRMPFPGSHLDSVVFLFLVQAIMCAWWPLIFFKYKRVLLACIFILIILIAQLACLAIMGADEEWLSFGLMLVLFLWCLFAAILNSYWVYVVRTHKVELDKYDSNCEEFYDNEDDNISGRTGKKIVRRV